MNIDRLYKLDACREAKDWAAKQSSPQQAWDDCHRADWMLWLLQRTQPECKQKYVAIACELARTVLPLVIEGELRPLRAIEEAEKYVSEQTRVNAAASNSAAANAYASDSAWASAAAEEAAYAAAHADIVRKYFPVVPE